MKQLKKWSNAVLVGAAMTLALGCARDYDPGPGIDTSLATWDEDEDGLLSSDEYEAGLEDAGFFEEWDENDDSFLTSNELGFGIFEEWDADNDGYVMETEFQAGANEWFGGGNRYGTFSEWDADADGRLGQGEFMNGIGQVQANWDENRNNLIEADEFSDGLFEDTDANNDGVVQGNEFGLQLE